MEESGLSCPGWRAPGLVFDKFGLKGSFGWKDWIMTCEEVKLLISARLDGEINALQCVAIDSHLEVEACRSCNEEMEAQETLRAAIRDQMPYYRTPAHLIERLTSALRAVESFDDSARWTHWKALGAVAAALLLAVLGAAPFLVNGNNQRQIVADELLSSHVRALFSHTVDVASSDQHTVKPWFNGKVTFSPPVVDLASEGFPLEGGRLDSVGARLIATLVYRRHLHRIDVFVWPAGRETPPAYFERDGYNEISWTKNDFVFAAVSDLNATELNEFAGLLKKQ
jgi:anti-sigma factor RsiW